MTANNERDLSAVEANVMAAEYRDGLLDLFLALLLGALGLTWLIAPGIVAIVAALAVVFGPRAFERAKQAITYPRIGYSQPRSEPPRRVALGMAAFSGLAFAASVVVIALAGDITDATEWRRWAPLLAGLAMSGGFFYLWERSGLHRYGLIAIGSMVVGAGIVFASSGTDYRGVAAYLFVMAAIFLVTGIIALTGFVRAHPSSDEPT